MAEHKKVLFSSSTRGSSGCKGLFIYSRWLRITPWYPQTPTMQGRRQRQRGPCASIQDSPPWSGIKYPSTHFIGQSRSHGKETDTDLPWTSLGVSAMVCHPNAHNGLQSPRRCFLEIVHKHSNLTISTQSEDIEEGPSLTLTAWSQGILDFADSMSVFQVWLLQSFQIKLFGFANLIFCLFGTTPRYSQSLSLASLRYHS